MIRIKTYLTAALGGVLLSLNVGSAKMITSRGEATILNGDVAAAREEALIDAQRNALEQAWGVKLRSETAVQDYALVDDTILSMISGYVKTAKILSETQDRELLTLEVQCDVAPEITDDEALPLVRNFSCVVGLDMQIDGQTVADQRLAGNLTSHLVEAGFDVRDMAQLAGLEGLSDQFAAALEKNDNAAARTIGRRMLSNIVIVGRAKFDLSQKKELYSYTGPVGVYAYDCWLDVRAVETESGRIIAQHAPGATAIRGVGETPQSALNDALAETQKTLGAEITSQLAIYAKAKRRPITVEIQGIPTVDQFLQIKQSLKNIRFRDSDVADLGFEAGKTSVFRFDYSENINLVALKLEHLPYLTVDERTQNKIVCRYSRAE